jgi:hypothetical protein
LIIVGCHNAFCSRKEYFLLIEIYVGVGYRNNPNEKGTMHFDRLKWDMKRSGKNAIRWLREQGKIARTVGLVGSGILLFIILLGFVPFSNQVLKIKVERILKESFVDSCTVDKLTITLWTGVSVKNIRCAWHDPSGVLYTCAVPEAGVSYHVLPIIFKHLIIKNIMLEKPRLTCIVPAAPALPPTAPHEQFSLDKFSDALAGFPYTVFIKNITLSKARIFVTQKRNTIMDCRGLGLSMKIGLDRSIALDGACEADSVCLLEAWHLTRLKAGLKIRGLKVTLDNCKAECYGGRISARAGADLTRSTLDELGIAVSHVKLDQWYADEKAGPGRLTGKLDASMDFQPSMLCVDSLKASGTIKITGVAASDLPLQKNLIVVLAVPRLATMHFSKISSDLDLKNGKIFTENIKGEGDPMDFKADGWVDMDGRFSERVNAEFSGEFMRTLPPLFQKSLLPVEGDPDKRAFTCSASGTFKNPHVSVDQRIVNRAVENIITEIGKFFR